MSCAQRTQSGRQIGAGGVRVCGEKDLIIGSGVRTVTKGRTLQQVFVTVGSAGLAEKPLYAP